MMLYKSLLLLVLDYEMQCELSARNVNTKARARPSELSIPCSLQQRQTFLIYSKVEVPR